MEIRVTTKEQEELVLENMRLVWYLANKMSVQPSDYEDLISIGTIGLIKAAVTFDKTKKLKFATYAAKCINNEFFMHYRKYKHVVKEISLDDVIYENGEDEGLTLSDILSSSTEDISEQIAEEIENNENFSKVINIILNLLNPRERTIMLYRLAEVNQSSISESLNIAQSYVSRLERRILTEIKKHYTTEQHYMGVYKMEKVGNMYSINFSSKDVKNFNRIISTFFEKMESIKSLPDFKINCNNERVVILLPADLESFSFVAKIMQEIDNFSITFASDKNAAPAIRNEIQNKECGTPDADEIEEPINESTNAIISESKETISDEIISKEGKISDVKQVRDYMMTLESFSVKDLKHHFPDLKIESIRYVIHSAKTRGWITSDGRGKYVVKKT